MLEDPYTHNTQFDSSYMSQLQEVFDSADPEDMELLSDKEEGHGHETPPSPEPAATYGDGSSAPNSGALVRTSVAEVASPSLTHRADALGSWRAAGGWPW